MRQQPASAFLIKNIVQVFCNRTELLPADDTIEEHNNRRQKESELLELDKTSPEGLFKGCFTAPLKSLVRDEQDGVIRCAACGYEWEGAPYCEQCRMSFNGDEESFDIPAYSDSASSSSGSSDAPVRMVGHMVNSRQLREGFGIESDPDSDEIGSLNEFIEYDETPRRDEGDIDTWPRTMYPTSSTDGLSESGSELRRPHRPAIRLYHRRYDPTANGSHTSSTPSDRSPPSHVSIDSEENESGTEEEDSHAQGTWSPVQEDLLRNNGIHRSSNGQHAWEEEGEEEDVGSVSLDRYTDDEGSLDRAHNRSRRVSDDISVSLDHHANERGSHARAIRLSSDSNEEESEEDTPLSPTTRRSRLLRRVIGRRRVASNEEGGSERSDEELEIPTRRRRLGQRRASSPLHVVDDTTPEQSEVEGHDLGRARDFRVMEAEESNADTYNDSDDSIVAPPRRRRDRARSELRTISSLAWRHAATEHLNHLQSIRQSHPTHPSETVHIRRGITSYLRNYTGAHDMYNFDFFVNTLHRAADEVPRPA